MVAAEMPMSVAICLASFSSASSLTFSRVSSAGPGKSSLRTPVLRKDAFLMVAAM